MIYSPFSSSSRSCSHFPAHPPHFSPPVLPSVLSFEISGETSSPLLGPTLGSQQVLIGTTTAAQALHFRSAERQGYLLSRKHPKQCWPSPACTPGELLLCQQLQGPPRAQGPLQRLETHSAEWLHHSSTTHAADIHQPKR